MNEEYAFVIGFSALLSLSTERDKPLKPDAFRKVPGEILKQSLEMFACLSVLIGLFWLVRQIENYGWRSVERESAVAFFWIGAAMLKRWRKHSPIFFMTLCGYSLFIQWEWPTQSLWSQWRDAYLLSFFTGVVCFWLAGMKRQISLLHVPEAMRGLPVFLLGLAGLALAANVFFP